MTDDMTFKSAQEWAEGDGDCMRAAADLMMRSKHGFFPGGKWKVDGEPFLVHALVWGRGPASGHRFPHAWVEVGDVVHDNSSGSERQLPKMIYYAIGNINPDERGAYARYSYDQMRRKLMSEGHYGPWDLDSDLGRQPEQDEYEDDDEDGEEKTAARGAKLGDFVKLKVGMEDADFWIVRRGTPEKVGTPVREWGPELIGVKVERTDLLLPDYLFYMMMHIAGTGYFRRLATGSTGLVNIRISDVGDLPMGGGAA